MAMGELGESAVVRIGTMTSVFKLGSRSAAADFLRSETPSGTRDGAPTGTQAIALKAQTYPML
jgi:hypothetical protein